jgi:putative sterol carrier protein
LDFGEVVSAIFPSAEWLDALCSKLNEDGRYAEIARHWEGDLVFDIEPEGHLSAPVRMYLDLWHGKCRRVEYLTSAARLADTKFVLRSPYNNFAAFLLGKLDPMTAMLTSKLKVTGSLGYMMRNIPTVLDFVRCAREITGEIL